MATFDPKLPLASEGDFGPYRWDFTIWQHPLCYGIGWEIWSALCALSWPRRLRRFVYAFRSMLQRDLDRLR